MHQIDLIIQRIEHTLSDSDESNNAEALRACLCDVYRIAAGEEYDWPPAADSN